MKGATLARIIVGGILAGLALYYSIEVTVQFIIFDADPYRAPSQSLASELILIAFRSIPGITFAFLYWRAGALLSKQSWPVKGLILGLLFSLLNESLAPSNLYDMIQLGNYLALAKFFASVLLINVAMGYLVVFVVPVYPIGEKK